MSLTTRFICIATSRGMGIVAEMLALNANKMPRFDLVEKIIFQTKHNNHIFN